jgi:hypothetical protein
MHRGLSQPKTPDEYAILAESGLSFVGLGIPPPTPSWGNMLTNSLQYVFRDPWLVIVPGAFIFVSILSVYLLTDGLRDALDLTSEATSVEFWCKPVPVTCCTATKTGSPSSLPKSPTTSPPGPGPTATWSKSDSKKS